MTEEVNKTEVLGENSLCVPEDEGTEEGVAIVEIVLILAVLLGLILIFRTQVTAIITSVFESINNTVSSIL